MKCHSKRGTEALRTLHFINVYALGTLLGLDAGSDLQLVTGNQGAWASYEGSEESC